MMLPQRQIFWRASPQKTQSKRELLENGGVIRLEWWTFTGWAKGKGFRCPLLCFFCFLPISCCYVAVLCPLVVVVPLPWRHPWSVCVGLSLLGCCYTYTHTHNCSNGTRQRQSPLTRLQNRRVRNSATAAEHRMMRQYAVKRVRFFFYSIPAAGTSNC